MRILRNKKYIIKNKMHLKQKKRNPSFYCLFINETRLYQLFTMKC